MGGKERDRQLECFSGREILGKRLGQFLLGRVGKQGKDNSNEGVGNRTLALAIPARRATAATDEYRESRRCRSRGKMPSSNFVRRKSSLIKEWGGKSNKPEERVIVPTDFLSRHREKKRGGAAANED